LGYALLENMNSHIWEKYLFCFEITVEKPTEVFTKVRDVLDIQAIKQKGFFDKLIKSLKGTALNIEEIVNSCPF